MSFIQQVILAASDLVVSTRGPANRNRNPCDNFLFVIHEHDRGKVGNLLFLCMSCEALGSSRGINGLARNGTKFIVAHISFRAAGDLSRAKSTSVGICAGAITCLRRRESRDITCWKTRNKLVLWIEETPPSEHSKARHWDYAASQMCRQSGFDSAERTT